MKLRTHVWNELRSPEIIEVRDKGGLVLIPTGSTEQHSAHLPLDTDIFSATAISLRAAELVDNPPVLVSKALHVGFSPHHMARPGTLSLRLETFLSVLTDVVKSIYVHGFRKILIVNGHGGNIAPLIALGNQLTTDGYATVVCSYWGLINNEMTEILEGERKVVGHSCEFETSIQLHLRPESVDISSAVTDLHAPWNPSLSKDVLEEAGAIFPPIFRKNSTGLLGDPTLATAEKGKRLFEAASLKLAQLIHLLKDLDLGQ